MYPSPRLSCAGNVAAMRTYDNAHQWEALMQWAGESELELLLFLQDANKLLALLAARCA